MASKPIIYKLILVGNTSVGKTSLFKKIISDEFSERNMATIGVDRTTLYSDIEIKIKDKTEKHNFEIHLYDSAGQEQFRSITKSFFKQSDGILLLYDVTKRESFEQIKMWLDSLEESLGENNNLQYVVILLGNKIDLIDKKGNKEVSEEEAIEKCQESNFIWGGEISAKTFSKEELINKINIFIKELYKRLGPKKTGKQISKKLDEKKKKKKSCFFL